MAARAAAGAFPGRILPPLVLIWCGLCHTLHSTAVGVLRPFVQAHPAAPVERYPPRTTPVAPATPVPRCNSCAPQLLPAGHAEPVALHLNRMLPHSTAATVVLRSFCQPGMLTRPARDVEPSRVVDAVEHGMRITVSMHSLPVVLCSHCRP